MFENILMLTIFLLSGIVAEYYCYLRGGKNADQSNKYVVIARILIYSAITLLIRCFIASIGGHRALNITQVFNTINNYTTYIGLSLILGVIMPNVYMLIEKKLKK